MRWFDKLPAFGGAGTMTVTLAYLTKKVHIKNNILIVGVGNTLMGDDGIGAYVAASLDTLPLPGVQTVTVQQMTSDLLDDMLKADHTIIVDAAVEAMPVQFYKVEETAPRVLPILIIPVPPSCWKWRQSCMNGIYPFIYVPWVLMI